jgi:thiosulfate/3-mercaptopyruvate sulfurtransferase
MDEVDERSCCVSGEWLARHLDEVVVVDTRWYLDGRSGRAAYESGHIPGAVFLDADRVISSPASREGGRHPLPSPETFAQGLGDLGIGDADHVIAYDDASGSVAARLWWLLRAIGQWSAVLDGGLSSWQGELSTAEAPRPPVRRSVRPFAMDRFVDADEVQAASERAVALILDARSASRYEGGDPLLDPRHGHVPGARSAPWQANLDPATGQFLDRVALRKRYRVLGADELQQVIAYCGSGITACHDLLALELAGFSNGRLYTGSWSAWGADPTRPAEVGPDAGAAPGSDRGVLG